VLHGVRKDMLSPISFCFLQSFLISHLGSESNDALMKLFLFFIQAKRTIYMIYVKEGVHVNHHRESILLGLIKEWSGLNRSKT
jgi:hypothetical protein